MQRDDETRLLQKASEYDSAALGELYDRYASRIYSYIHCHVGDQQLAEDLTANVFIKMLDAIRASKGWQQSFLGWLYRIAHNLVVDFFRQHQHQRYVPLDERLASAHDDPVVAAEKAMAAQSLGAALTQLTEEQQLVITLKFVEGLSNLQVAEIMGKTEGAIKSLQYRALASLRRVLEGGSSGTYGQEPG